MNQLPDISQYWHIAVRRKYWIIITFLVTILAGLTYALTAPRIFVAKTLILVESQRVPQDFVRSIVSSDIEERLKTITQQVTSRTNLESIVKEHQVYSEEPGSGMTLEGQIELLRKNIKIDVARGGGRGGSAFTIEVLGKDRVKVTRVTNTLASNFISENLKNRESQVLGTSAFIADELESVRKQLLEKEEEYKKFREKHMGGLPEQLQTNLTILQRLQLTQEQIANSIRDAENRKILIRTQMATQHSGETPQTRVPGSSGGERERPSDLASLRSELAGLQARYTPSHPDVIRVKEMIGRLEQERAKTEAQPDKTENPSAMPGVDAAVRRQYMEVEHEVMNLKVDQERLKSQIKYYQQKVEETPLREQELISVNRDYNNLKETYNTMLRKKLDAEISVSMERKQKGEQFRILDTAKEPERPIKPDVPSILLMTVALALGLGGGVAYLRDMMDTSFRKPEEIEKELKLPILVSIPFKHTKQEIKGQKRKEIFKAAGVAAGFAVSVVAIVVGTKGFGATVRYIKELAGL